MEILFDRNKLKKEFNNEGLLIRSHGALRSRKVQRRLAQLSAAEKLEDLRNTPGRCHELKGDRGGQLSLDLDHPYRLIFKPADNPPAIKEDDGGIDWKRVMKITILGVEDTHE